MSALTEGLAATAEGIPEIGGGVEDAHALVNGAELVCNLLKGNFRDAAADGVAGAIRAFGGTTDLVDGPLGMLVGPGTELLAQGAHNLIAKKKDAPTAAPTDNQPSLLGDAAKEALKTTASVALAKKVPFVATAMSAGDAAKAVSDLLHGKVEDAALDAGKAYVWHTINNRSAVMQGVLIGGLSLIETRHDEKTSAAPQKATGTPQQAAGQSRYGNAPFTTPSFSMPAAGDLFKNIPLAGDAVAAQ